jgi:VWFA-related protein
MKKEIAITVILLSLLIGDLSLLAWPSTFAAQSSDRKPPKKEKFGSSLKRLKWDPNKQAAVESEQDNQKRNREIEPGDVIKVETNLVVLDLFVMEKTELRALTGLGKDDFVVTEDGVTQQISMFSVGADPNLPRSIVLIIDFSSSMSRFLEKSVEAAKILVNRLGPKDEMAIVNDEVELMVGFTGDKKRLKSALDSLKNRPRGAHGSRQLSALFVTLRELSGVGQGRPIIIIQSDGDEIVNLRDQQPRAEGQPSTWEFGLADIQAAALGTRATIYTLIPGEPLIGAPLDEARLRVRRSMRMIDERHNPEAIVKFAEALLSRQFDQEARLVGDRVFSGFKSVVVRCHVESRGAGLPDALIVKKAREDRFGYFPDSQATPNAARELFNDWAAARFLDGLGHDPPLSPRFYAGDREHGLIVLEDLGDGEAPNTIDALQGHDPQLAEQTLVEHAALLGKLHAATMGRYEEYRHIRLGLGPAPQPLKLYHDPWSDARLSCHDLESYGEESFFNTKGQRNKGAK